MAAFAGESQANRKYLAFAAKAEKEGKTKIARLFRAVAEAETIHALKHLETAGKVGSTVENVKAAVEGEAYEFTQMYPDFITQAEEEGQNAAARSFKFANAAEKEHAELYKKALEAVEKDGDLEAQSFHLCPVCGYVAVDHAPDHCPICNAPAKSFKAY
jgi:rubrerythrin